MYFIFDLIFLIVQLLIEFDLHESKKNTFEDEDVSCCNNDCRNEKWLLAKRSSDI